MPDLFPVHLVGLHVAIKLVIYCFFCLFRQ